MAKVQCVQQMNNGINYSFYWFISLVAYEIVSRVTTKRRKASFKPVELYSVHSSPVASAGN